MHVSFAQIADCEHASGVDSNVAANADEGVGRYGLWP
jgi:hypothetical protein